MARTRAEISALVVLNTGRSDKTSYINSQLDNGLKIALSKHPFQDTLHICDDVAITLASTSVSISDLKEATVSIGDVYDIVTATIVDASGSSNTPLVIKNRQWWDKNVINAEDNTQGRPCYGMRWGSTMHFDRPSDSGLELRMRVSVLPSFTGDSTVCPIKLLDVFLEQYATAMVYLSLGMEEKYVSWYIMALGRQFDIGEAGGTLLAAIQKDKSDTAEDKQVERGSVYGNTGTSILNKTVGMDTFGQTKSWY